MPARPITTLALAAPAVFGCAAAALQVLRLADLSAERRAWRRLGAARPMPAFHPTMVAGLPEPARRYFLYSIREGARLSTVAEIELEGELALGGKADPRYLRMRARQILADGDGFVWRLAAGAGPVRISGSDGLADGEAWTRFWLYGAVPVVRAGDAGDFARSAAGRAIAESVFWVPAALLPSEAVSWAPGGPDSARLLVRRRGHEHRVDLVVDPDGRPRSVRLLRWSRENPERQWRLQPFGGTMSGAVEAQGYRVAAAVEGGNGFGTPDYFPFYRAKVVRLRYR
jgi:hypothetical protein